VRFVAALAVSTVLVASCGDEGPSSAASTTSTAAAATDDVAVDTRAIDHGFVIAFVIVLIGPAVHDDPVFSARGAGVEDVGPVGRRAGRRDERVARGATGFGRLDGDDLDV
jgi:hypothetical protein